MRSFIIAVLFTTACAHSSPRGAGEPVNVAAVRSEINGTITSESGDRSIYSMGKTRIDRATVYTSSKSGEKQEETWIKVGGRWKLETKTAVKEGA